MLTKHLYFLPYEFYDLILILFLNPVYVLDGVCVCVCVCVVKVGWEEEEQGHNQIINNQMEKK